MNSRFPHGVERTMAVAQELAGQGFCVVPHLAGRSIGSREQLVSMLRDCHAAGITEVFAIGGDKAQAAGPYDSGESLIRDIADISGGRYNPDDFVSELAGLMSPLAGIHQYSFNSLDAFAPLPA